MTRTRYPNAVRVLLDDDLVEFAKDEARLDGTNLSTVLRQALAARRDRRRAEERENFRQAAALHRQIEDDFLSKTGGY